VAVVVLLGLISFCALWVGLEVWAYYQTRQTKQALARHDYPAAWEHANKALKVRGRNPELHLLAARAARLTGKYEDAADHLQACFDSQGGTSEPLQLEHIMLKAQTGHVEEVFESLFVYVNEDRPEAPLILEAICSGLLSQNLYGMATYCTQEWVKRDKNDSQALFMHGSCLAMQNAWDEAATHLEHAKVVAPERDDIKLVLARVYVEMKKYSEAAELFEALLAHGSDDPVIRTGLARCKVGLSDLEGARAFLDRQIDEDTSDADLLTERGKLAALLDRPQEAERWFRKALNNSPYHHDALFSLEQCLQYQGKHKQATEMGRRRSVLEEEEHRLMDLMQKLNTPTRPTPAVYDEIGQIYLRRGNTDFALYWLYKALTLDRSYEPSHKALVAHYEKMGDKQNAQQHRRWLRSEQPPPPSDSRP
jgi:tetratricopeptide (TPR) repeat protein